MKSAALEEQVGTVSFLERLFGTRSSVQTISTHASRIFLTGEKAYKLKLAVHFPYLDYSTPHKRHEACLKEFELNSRTAPALYVGVRTITRKADGGLEIDGDGSLVDALLEMRRFDQDCLFDRMAQNGSLTGAIVSDLAHQIAAFHREAPINREMGGVKGIAQVLDINDRSLRATGLVADDVAATVAARFQETLLEHSQVLEKRRLSGRVRRCHGDLTLRNICLWQGVPTLFDCIEFDESIATIDVLYDLAFLLMDLWHREQRDLASILLNRYLDETDEADGLGLVPFFMAIRAAVRAHVTAIQAKNALASDSAHLRAEAMQYFDLAQSLLQPSPPALVAIGGLSGSGKSTVASLSAPYLGSTPGARILSSDRIRKRLFGVSAQTRLPEAAYQPEISAKVYETQRREATIALACGAAVVVDAVFDRPDERKKIEKIAAEGGVSFSGYWLDASEKVLVSRVMSRLNDPSDATVDVVVKQVSRDCGEIDWVRLDASRDPATISDDILRRCGIGTVPS
ncbi:AAA family ATPase [Microvirga flavescens]|uniref:bifunctional aminoglycoside phosphotransferase/ATP-binding protein n=1 Tax=Microvirga flavescens TaxID=2249811 RepID=UPI000DDBA2D6|nr:bifunctional aminoglycoside phosphotransferase/ATP-binding protein [Microvirga flavescens]